MGEVFLCPFNHHEYPNNLDEMMKDSRNMGRYRIVGVRNDEVRHPSAVPVYNTFVA